MSARGTYTMEYHIGPLPDRKKIALSVTKSGFTRTVAYFDDEDDARDFMVFVDRLVWPNGDRTSGDWHGWAEVLT